MQQLDRHKLAQEFIAQDRWGKLRRYVGVPVAQDILLRDVAQMIDFRIPKAFVKWRDKIHDGTVLWSIHHTKLTFHFPENYKLMEQELGRQQRFAGPNRSATANQCTHLKALLRDSGYVLTKPVEELAVSEASTFIDFLADDKPLPESLVKLLE